MLLIILAITAQENSKIRKKLTLLWSIKERQAVKSTRKVVKLT